MRNQIEQSTAESISKGIEPIAKSITANAASAADSASGLGSELLKRADKVTEWATNGISKVADAAYDQAVDIATQYIHFGMAINTLCILISIAVFSFGVWLAVKAKNYKNEDLRKQNDVTAGLLCSSALTAGIGALIFSLNIRDTLLVYFAPKIWIMKEMAILIKTSNIAN